MMTALVESWVHLSWYSLAATCASLLAAGCFLYSYLSRLRYVDAPPCNYGWIPFLGCAVEFGKRPLLFINEMRHKLGSVFTIYVGGKRMTFLHDEDDYKKYFLQSEYIDFQKAVLLFVENAASITPSSFMKYHTNIHDMMKGRLAIGQLSNHSEDLKNQFEKRLLEMCPSGDVELNELIRLVMYPAVIRNLFGENVLPIHDDGTMRELMDKFVLFDDQFEYGTQIPQMFLKDWANSKSWLLNMFRTAMKKIQPGDTTLLRNLYDVVDKEHSANYSLLMLWASLANAIPITFWTIAYILDNPDVKEKVIKTIDAARNETGELIYDAATLEKLAYIKCCYIEAIRLRSPGVITRMVVSPFNVKGYTVPAGDLLFLSPYWVHRNEEFFPEPEKYRPERFSNHDWSKNLFPRGFVAFGGGRYMCPGRWYALMELQIIVSMFFSKFEMKPSSPFPKPDVMHLVGVQQPATQYIVTITDRKS